jgi:hypothetical protein
LSLHDTKVQVGLRLPYGLRQRVKAEARRHGRSINREIVRRIEQSFAREEIGAIIKAAAKRAAIEALQGVRK